MPSIVVYTNPLAPGTAQIPVYAVGDDQNWQLKFSDGANFYDPTGVSMNIGYVKGLANGTYPSAFQWVDRMNNQHVGSFVMASALANSLTWDENPINVFGANGAFLVKGRTPPASRIRKVYVKYGGAGTTTVPALRFNGGATLTGQQATATATIAGTAISAINLTYGGFGYSIPPQVVITGDGTGAKVRVATIVNGAVATFAIDSAGTGYTTATVTFVDPEASATATVGGTSAVTGLTVVNQGSGYTTAPTVALTGGGGTLATATAALANASWGLTNLILTAAGTGFTSVPTVAFTGGTGSGAAGVATVSPAGFLTAITITNPGDYFCSAGQFGIVSVAISGGGGSGATGFVNSSYSSGHYTVDSVLITNAGSGYTSAPTITFSFAVLSGTATTIVDAAGTAVVAVGTITSLTLTSTGTGYGATGPTVSFTGGGGTGATATVALIGSPISPVLTLTAGGSGYTSAPLVGFSGGAGTGASATSSVTLGITAVTVTRTGISYTSLPSITTIPESGALLIPAGIESHSYPFLQEFSPSSAQQAITATPYTTGRRDSAGSLIYDDSLLIIRPRYVVQPTFVLQPDGLTWAAVFAPVNNFVNAVLGYRRSISMDIEIFGAGRLLYVGQITVLLS
jgi:hypothetical protein